MTPNEARTEISDLAIAMLRSGIAATVNTPIITSKGSFKRITWPAAASIEQGLFSALPFATITEYRRMILENQFVALLRDGALLQLSMDIRANSLTGHRFGFYPCPILVPDGFNVLDFEGLDLMLMDELGYCIQAVGGDSEPRIDQLRMRSPLRFDYAPDAASASEPASHVHILNSDARIAVQGPLCLGHFIQFIFKHFYPKDWNDESLEYVTRWPIRDMDRTISLEEESTLHFNFRRAIIVTLL
ncbi:MAG: DUF2290 domain-containing protein [Terracidiphilus sp.]